MTINRRTVPRRPAAGAGAGARRLGAPAIAQAAHQGAASATCTRRRSTARSGSASDRGASTKHGLELELIQFTTGLELFQAMIGGSLDMLATGAVISNFPARGQGKVFLRQQRRVRDRAALGARRPGHQGLRRPEGQADLHHDRHHRARVPRHARCAPTSSTRRKDVEIVNQRMAEAVTSFISGAVPAVALWVPFNVTVARRCRRAKMLVDASAYYPAGGDRRRLGRAQRLLRRRTARRCARSSRGWARGQRLSGRATPTRRSRRCRRSTTSRCRSPTSRSSSRRAEDVHLAGVAQALRRRHGHQVAAAGDRLLRQARQHPEPGAGVAVLRPEALPRDGQGAERAVAKPA